MSRRRISILPLVLALTACQGSGQVSPAASPSGDPLPSATATASPTAEAPSGLILFHRKGANGVEHYFTIEPDGTNEQALFTAEGCGCAYWSDLRGTQILSIGPTGQGTWSLLTMDPRGGNQVVAIPPIEELNLFVGASSADGTVIAFNGVHDTDPSLSGLYIASPDLADVRLVTPLKDGWMAAEPYGVTPDGSRIVFFVETGPVGDITHGGDLYVIDADGSALRQLNPAGVKIGFFDMPMVSLSPDGRQAAFGLDDTIFVVDLEGGDARPITPRTGFTWAPAWSPTGEWITYTRVHGTTTVISLVRPDGSEDHEISALSGAEVANAGVWSPDGDYLLVRREDDLWIIDVEGRFIGQVTHEPSTYERYSWAPAPGS